MSNTPPPQDLDPKTRLRIAIKRSKYKAAIAKEAEAALREVVMMILEDEEVSERIKDVVRERYEGFVERRDGLVERQLAEYERLVVNVGLKA